MFSLSIFTTKEAKESFKQYSLYSTTMQLFTIIEIRILWSSCVDSAGEIQNKL